MQCVRLDFFLFSSKTSSSIHISLHSQCTATADTLIDHEANYRFDGFCMGHIHNLSIFEYKSNFLYMDCRLWTYIQRNLEQTVIVITVQQFLFTMIYLFLVKNVLFALHNHNQLLYCSDFIDFTFNWHNIGRYFAVATQLCYKQTIPSSHLFIHIYSHVTHFLGHWYVMYGSFALNFKNSNIFQ